ncbi:MAG TPA: MmcQ/YjbR family DNA-binding protein [Thermomicrobiales bacterium]|nr:MmcQ/YjbR family DNA-binding protein [Thermomicrobiales bacterium]
MQKEPLERVRALCLALPEATEKAEGRPAFQMRGKTFAMYMDNHHDDGRVALWCKAAPGAQDVPVRADSERFFVPPYVGPQGWVGMRLDRDIDWEEVGAILVDAYRLQAPKRLAALLDQH